MSEGSEFKEQAKDLLAGTTAGLISKVVEYPFDTIKVRMQTNNKYTGVLQCARDMASKEGARVFYRGVAAPVAGAMLESSLMFWGYGAAARLLGGKNNLSLSGITLCGAISGIPMAIWLTPVEFLKCRLQASHTAKLYDGIYGCFQHTIKSQGPAVLFTGATATMMREVPGGAVYFASYEVISRTLTPKGEQASTLTVIAGGGLAGFSFWAAVMPFDVIKSRMQTVVTDITPAQTAFPSPPSAPSSASSPSPSSSSSSLLATSSRGVSSTITKGLSSSSSPSSSSSSSSSASILGTARQIYAQRGISGFYVGITVTAPRAIISNAIVFVTYERIKSFLDAAWQ